MNIDNFGIIDNIKDMNLDAHLRLRHIRTFLEIARAESVSVAAARLNLSQPAVSRSLKELEEILATPLFDRVGRGLALNDAGRVFQAHATASMVELLRARDRLSKDGDLKSRLSVGVLPTAASELVPSAALAFREEMRSVSLHILTGPNWLLFDQLREGSVDLVVGRMAEGEKATGIGFQQLYIEDVVLVCRPGHPILRKSHPEERLSNHDLILPPPGAVIAQTVERYLGSIGFPKMRSAIETVALPIGRKIVSRSDALWFISRGVVADELAAGSLVAVPLASPLLSGPVGISIAQSAPISLERSVFANCLRQAAAKLARTKRDTFPSQ